MNRKRLLAATSGLALAGIVLFSIAPAAGQSQDRGNRSLPAAAEAPAGLGGFYIQGQNSPYAVYMGNAANDPVMSKLLQAEHQAERQAASLLKQYAGTDKEEQRAGVKVKLTEALGKQFDTQQKRRDVELARLEAQVKKLRELLKKRTDSRQVIVEKRLDQLLREADGLGWTAPPGPGSLTPPANYNAFTDLQPR